MISVLRHRSWLLAGAALLSVGLSTASTHGALVAYYNYDNPADLGADSSGNNNHLTGAGGGPTAFAGGVHGGAADFSGAGQMLQSAAFPVGVPTGNSAYTVSTWFNADASGSRGFVGWGNYGTANTVNATRLGGSTEIHNYWWGNDMVVGGLPDLVAGSAPDGWHHVVATYNPQSHEQRIYLNGQQVGARVANNALNVNASNFAVGRTCTFCGGGEFLDGQLDDTAIYSNTLAPNQIVALGKGLTTANNLPAASPLVGLWRFEHAAQPGFDSSGVQNHLIANGQAQTAGGGQFGNGLLLDGTDDFLAANLGGTGTITGLPFGDSSYAITAWFKPDAASNPQGQPNGIVGWGNYGADNQVTAIRMNGANGYSHYWWGADQVVGGQPTSVDGIFHHIVAMYDADTGIRSILIDGVVIASDNPADHNAGFANFAIGRTATGVFGLNEWFDGMLDDVAIFNRALTLEEIDAVRRGDFSAFLAVAAVPEPATALTGLVGLGLLAMRRRRAA